MNVIISKQEQEREAAAIIQKVMAQVMMRHQLYAALMLKLRVRADWRAQTMYTDARVLGYNPAFVHARGIGDLCFIFAHEITHCALGHPQRSRRIPQEHRDLWNEAGDHAVNLILKRDPRLEVPADALCDPSFEGWTADAIYAVLLAKRLAEQQQQQQQQEQDEQDQQQAQQQPQQQQQQQEQEEEQEGQGEQQRESDGGSQQIGVGTSHGDVIAPGEAGDEGEDAEDEDAEDGAEEESDEQGGAGQEGESAEGLPPQPMHDEASDAALEREWQEALSAAAVAGDETSEKLERRMREVLAPRRSFYDALYRFVAQRVREYEDWGRRNRRFSGVYLPSRGGIGLTSLVFALDTSGSISEREVGAFAGVVQAVFAEMNLQHCWVLYCDTRVRRIDEFDTCPNFDAKVPGGGGTFFHPVFEFVREQQQEGADIACVVYLTDQDNFDREQMSSSGFEDIPTLWVNTRKAQPAPFGEVVSLLD